MHIVYIHYDKERQTEAESAGPMRRADSRPPGLHGAPNGYYSQQFQRKGCFVAPQNRELLREAQLRRVEDILTQAVDEARKGGIPLEELQELLNLLYQGDES